MPVPSGSNPLGAGTSTPTAVAALWEPDEDPPDALALALAPEEPEPLELLELLLSEVDIELEAVALLEDPDPPEEFPPPPHAANSTAAEAMTPAPRIFLVTDLFLSETNVAPYDGRRGVALTSMSSHRKELLLQLLLCNSNPSSVACDVECENTSRCVGIVFFGLTVAFFRRNFTGQVHGNVFGHFEVKMP